MKQKEIRIYIAGKITGEPIWECATKFAVAVYEMSKIFDLKATIINPFNLSGIYFGIAHSEAMKICIHALSDCTHAYFLKDWKESEGARLEHQFCIDNNIKIIYQ